MALVNLISAAPTDARDPKAHLDLEQMFDSARADRYGQHHVVDDPSAADLIIFVETSGAAGYYFELVRMHPTYRAYKEKSYLFSSTDCVVPFLPGIFASIEDRWYWPSWTRSGHYLGVKERPELRFEPDASASLLFSFVGAAAAHPIRRRLLSLQPEDAVLIDTTGEDRRDAEEFVQRYARVLHASSFVLCPRGGGVSTFRLFEAMMLGRVPVVISDQWVQPTGPSWDEFSLHVAEADIEKLPSVLEERRSEAATMGRAARVAWLEWFSPAASFHRTVEWCLELAQQELSRRGVRAYAPYLQMLRPYHAARVLKKRLA